MCSAGFSPHHSPRGLNSPSPVTPLARTTAVIFQLVLLQGGVWVGGEGYPLREPLWKLRWGRPWPGCSSSLLGLNRWFSERARPVILGYEQCHLALGSPATPLRRGVPETFGGLVGWEETKTIL